MLVACQALIEIAEDLMVNRKILRFFLLGRFTQDFVENLFSLIRFRLSVPNALHFKLNLRVVTLAQICLLSNNSSYFQDTDEEVVLSTDFLAATRKLAEARKEEESLEQLMEGAAICVSEVSDSDLSLLDSWEWCVLYNMAGSVMRSLKNMNITTCETCFNSLLWHEEGNHPCSIVLDLMEYKDGALFAVSESCFKATLKAEITFRQMRDILTDAEHIDVVRFLVDALQYVWDGTTVPSCHDIRTKYLERFITMRFRTYALLRRRQINNTSAKIYGSKTMAMHTSVA